MTSLEGCSQVYGCIQIGLFELFYEGVNSNTTGIRQEVDIGCSGKNVANDADVTPELVTIFEMGFFMPTLEK
jgi:hypothetical protein